jgi:hypothetical protein
MILVVEPGSSKRGSVSLLLYNILEAGSLPPAEDREYTVPR